ncbi:hypothetical protein BJ965_005454 [Streptomyces luteogriseus]|uniref:AAA+ ATPase domain-containing protein n=1 Tax=Streptomyces luteogriseus TaxID=68233 RepID=A0A7W7DUF8_9ACTN|nr:hypothetical protein [Streptomyces luteogriseus]MBB4715572.1 hypothetical protein [Streptomyces luteogriseus]
MHGLLRSILLRAAEVVLGAALSQCGATRPDSARGLVRRLTDEVLRGGLSGDALLDRIVTHAGHQVDADRRALYEHCSRAIAQLVNTCPEFALTTATPGTPLYDTGADRGGIGLAGLEALLLECAGGQEAYAVGRGRLRDPIAALDSAGPRLPSLAQGYVNPRFRLADWDKQSGRDSGVASDKWWERRASYDTIEHFFAGYLLGLPALLSPLVVLGDPGAGKSLLTKLLTARLPIAEFRPLRVELRYTPAEADLQKQLEHALWRATGRSVCWPDWSEAEPGVIPVVLLDGFDELLQAGAQRLDSNRHWGYLREVERFQRREAELGRPLIVIVTSRTVVADHAEIPYNSQVLRLEPFGEPEIERWLAIWNKTNADYFDRHGLQPLLLDAVLPHRDLAAQPLLLLMLALYDAVDNAQHRLHDEDLSRTQLYDRLLTEFVRRQAEKDGPLPPAEAAAAVERELHRLSVVALGMFHRGAQAISSEEADRDLSALSRATAGGTELLFGRFFFVHEAQAVVEEERLRSYEFMHATFGEHLAARLIDGALRRLTDARSAAPGAPLNDGELYALLSFTPLTDRAQLVQNLRDRLQAWSVDSSTGLVPRLVGLFRNAAWGPEHRADVRYTPVRQTRTYRDAVYEGNLLLITVLVAGKVYASQLVDGEGDLIGNWRRHAMGWQAQLSPSSWELLTSTLIIDRCAQPPDLLISTTYTPRDHNELRWPKRLPDLYVSSVVDLIGRVMFTADADTDLLLHHSYPLLSRFPRAAAPANDGARSPAQLLLALLIKDVIPPMTLPGLYVKCLDQAVSLPPDEAVHYLEAVLRQLVHDAPAMPDEDLALVLSGLNKVVMQCLSGRLTPALTELLVPCVRGAVERASPRLRDVLASLRPHFESYDLRGLTRLSRSSHTWRWAGFPHGDDAARHLDGLLAGLNLQEAAARRPAALVDLLRLAVELDLHDWLSAHTSEILDALPAEAFGLLRPSDLRPLRAVLQKGAYEAQFREVEWVWRGATPPVGTPPPRCPPA